MSYDELGRVSAEFMGFNVPCAEEMWKEVELVYMNCDIPKRNLAFAYWKHTGYYESLAKAVKDFIEARDSISMNDNAEATYPKAKKLFVSSSEVIRLMGMIDTLLTEYYKKNKKG